MKLLKTKLYPARELAALKTCVLCVGLIAGAYGSEFIKRNLWWIALIGVVTYVRAMHYYWSSKGEDHT